MGFLSLMSSCRACSDGKISGDLLPSTSAPPRFFVSRTSGGSGTVSSARLTVMVRVVPISYKKNQTIRDVIPIDGPNINTSDFLDVREPFYDVTRDMMAKQNESP